jgi:hypothetical protein
MVTETRADSTSTAGGRPEPSSEGGAWSRLAEWVRHRCARHSEGDAGTLPRGRRDESSGSDLYRAVNVTKNITVAGCVEWAGTSETRRRGLLGRDHIGPSEGAYIVPTQWIHMFGMQFPIDVAFLDGDGRVLHLCHALQPNRLSPIVWRAEGALELAAGALASSGTEVGDIIEIR